MAAPIKKGLDYFPLNVDFFEDDKILAISGEFSVKGEIITLRLLCEIYRNGYFVEYTELLKNKLARLGGLSGGLVDEVTNKLVKYNFFNEDIFREHKVLTSVAIQKRYFEATKRRKNQPNSEYLLLKGVNVNINSSSKKVNVNINSQSKVKESKVNKSSSSDAPPPIKLFEKSENHEELKKTLKNHIEWKSMFAKQVGLKNLDVADRWIDKFVSHAIANGRGDEILVLREAKSYCLNWVRTRVKAGETPNTSIQSEGKFILGKSRRVIRHG